MWQMYRSPRDSDGDGSRLRAKSDTAADAIERHYTTEANGVIKANNTKIMGESDDLKTHSMAK